MSTTKQHLRLIGAFAALAALALAVSCRGFFVPEQLASITISPATANVPLGQTLQLTAYGTNTDGTTAGNLTKGVTWSSSGGAVSVSNSGLLTGNDLTSAAVTITAADQGVSGQATANVCVTNGSDYTITLSPTSPVQQNTPVQAYAYTTVSGVTGQVDISSGVTWSTNNSSVTISAGDPANIDTSGATPPVTVEIIAAYSCNGVNFPAFQTPLTIQ
jgi:Bacterial Ig-like domain (group 2)